MMAREAEEKGAVSEERLKMLMDTKEFEFIKNLPENELWKLLFAVMFVHGDEIVEFPTIHPDFLEHFNKLWRDAYKNDERR